MRLLFVSLCLSMLISGCKKDIDTTNNSEYIKGKFNGTELLFNKSSNDQSLFNNVHVYNEVTGSDQLNLIRQTSDNSYQVAFYFMGTRLQNQSIPYSLPSNVNSEYINFSLNDLKATISHQCLFCPSDSVNFSGDSYEGFRVTITDTANSYLRGNFEGTIATKTGKTMEVKNGSFNIKISRVSHL